MTARPANDATEPGAADRAYARFEPPPGRPAIAPGLDRMRVMLDRLGAPHNRLPPTIHIAGTNGKGSTVAYLRAFLEASGRRVHVFTSPHLRSVRECVRTATGPGASQRADDDRLADALARVDAASDGACRPTPFEALTLAALLLFAEIPADAVLLECGMGGGEDATNVIDRPVAAAVTAVSYDHLEFLGPGLADVAAAKAGVFKPGVPALIAPQPYDEAADVLAAAAAKIGAPLQVGGRDWLAYPDGEGMTYVSPRGARRLPAPALVGPHQIANAGTALATLEAAFPDAATPDVLAAGLTGVRWPGRLQRLPDIGFMQVWADGGHNDSAGAALAEWAAQEPPVALIVGMLANKNVAAFLYHLSPYVERLAAVPVAHAPRPAHDPAHVVDIAQGLGLTQVESAADVAAALRSFADAGVRRALVCGSLHLLPEVLPANAFGETTS